MDEASKKLQIKVFSPYETFFKGSATSISATNKTGPFDVLYGHANFFSVLTPGEVTVDTGFEPVVIQIESGVLHVRDNSVTLFANI